MTAVKENAINLINNLPDEISWDDLMYEFYVRRKVEIALQQVEDGKTTPINEARKKLMAL